VKRSKNKHQLNFDKDYVLIRDFALEKPTKVFQENQEIKSLKFTESKKICIQEYKNEKLETSIDKMVTTVRLWDPSKWSLTNSIEILIQKKIKCSELIPVIINYFPELIMEKISAYKLVNCNNLYLEDFEKLQFENLLNNSENFIDNFPFFLNSDGNLLILKDENKIIREPNEEEIKLYCKPNGKYSVKMKKENQTFNKTKISSKYKFDTSINKSKFDKNRPKEKGIQITVKKDLDEEYKSIDSPDKSFASGNGTSSSTNIIENLIDLNKIDDLEKNK